MKTLIKTIGLAVAALTLTAKVSANEADTNRATIAKAMDAWAAGTGGPYDLLADAGFAGAELTAFLCRVSPRRRGYISRRLRIAPTDDGPAFAGARLYVSGAIFSP